MTLQDGVGVSIESTLNKTERN